MQQRINFSQRDEQKISSLANWATLIAVVSVVSGVLETGTKLLTNGGEGAQLIGTLLGAMLGLGIALLLSVFLYQAGQSFRLMATTDGADEHYLIQGFDKLRAYFMAMGIILIIVLSIGGLVLLGALTCGLSRF
jgi:hypothetical protein